MSKLIAPLLLVCMLLVGCGARGANPEEKREAIRKLHTDSVAELVRRKPETQELMDRAAGVGVFTDVSIKVLVVGGGGGYGMVKDEHGKETYMKMGTVSAGFGLGLKDFKAVFILHDSGTLEKFLSGRFAFGAEADAAAKAGDQGLQGSAAAKTGGMSIYQWTNTGIALQASIAGTKYWLDKELNEGD